MYGFANAWINQGVGNVDYFISLFKQRLSDNLKQCWFTSVQNSSKCHHYSQFKTLLNVERYLNSDIPDLLRSSLSKFRCDNSNLAVETGRYNKVNYNERLCLFCKLNDKNVIEDEFHVLLKCERFSDLGLTYIQKYMTDLDPNVNFINIRKTSNDSTKKDVSTFLYYVLQHIRNVPFK